MTLITKIREFMKPETPRTRIDKITNYIRCGVAIYIISMGTMETCQCINNYDRDMVNSETEIGKILEDILDDIVEKTTII